MFFNRPLVVCAVFAVTCFVVMSASAQIAEPYPRPVYDGKCAITGVWIDSRLMSDRLEDQGGMYFTCSGTFVREVVAEVKIGYRSLNGRTVPQYPPTVKTYGGSTNVPIPGADSVVTPWTPRWPGYEAQTVAKISWQTDKLVCYGYSCGYIWESQTLTSEWR